jgi:hypothetical protein
MELGRRITQKIPVVMGRLGTLKHEHQRQEQEQKKG